MREWYILIEHQQIGPLTISELRENPDLTPDTWVWKKGFPTWVKARFVPELKNIFKDKVVKPVWSDKDTDRFGEGHGKSEYLILTMHHDPYQFLLWILLLLLTLFYVIYEIQ